MGKKRVIESDPFATRTTIKAKAKPLDDEMKQLRITLTDLQQIREDKIPDHEKLPRDCVFYRHYMQVQANSEIAQVAKDQIKDDKELLREIGDGLSPAKKGGMNPDLGSPLR